MLTQEFNWYKSNQAELVERHNGKVLAIKGEKVIGVFESTIDAYREMVKTHEPGTFLLQRVSPGESAYTQHFRTRAIFR